MLVLRALVLAFALAPFGAAAQTQAPQLGQDGKDAPWVATSQILINRMLAMAEIAPGDRLVDLGSGDGRTVITAAKQGVEAHGVELDQNLVALSRRNAEAAGVQKLARFKQADIFEADFSSASVVTIFMLGDVNLRLRPKLLAMKPGTRIVSNTFGMDDWEPDEITIARTGCGSFCVAQKWVVPAEVSGEWRLNGGKLKLEQRFQMLSGTIEVAGAPLPLADAKMDGARIAFTAGGRRYAGSVAGEVMTGVIEDGEAWRAKRVSK